MKGNLTQSTVAYLTRMKPTMITISNITVPTTPAIMPTVAADDIGSSCTTTHKLVKIQ
jgi:hypothetical protein